MDIKVKKLHPAAVLPKYATEGAACFDLFAIEMEPSRGLYAGVPVLVRTGLSFEIPEGHAMLIFSRSGHGFKNSVRLSNCVGVIDSDYRGEVMVRLHRDISHSTSTLEVSNGDRIAQAMIVPYPKVQFVESVDLSSTERGAGGFGSTGV